MAAMSQCSFPDLDGGAVETKENVLVHGKHTSRASGWQPNISNLMFRVFQNEKRCLLYWTSNFFVILCLFQKFSKKIFFKRYISL